MELKEFIKIALTDIIEAVRETQDEVKGYATIVPFVGMGNKESSVQMKSGIAKISSIDFDVAVSSGTKENGQNDSEARIKVAGIFNIGIGGREGAEKNAQHISRIRFSIPVYCLTPQHLRKMHLTIALPPADNFPIILPGEFMKH